MGAWLTKRKMARKLNKLEIVAIVLGSALVLAIIIWFSVKPPWHRKSSGDGFDNGSTTGIVEDEDNDGRSGGALEERLVPEHAEAGERFGLRIAGGYGYSNKFAYPLAGGERVRMAMGDFMVDTNGVVRHGTDEWAIVHDAERLLSVSSEAVWILGNRRVLRVSSSGVEVLLDDVDAMDGFVQGTDLVILTPHFVGWYDASTGAERTHVMEDGHAICTVDDDLCAVGVPSEERVRLYRRGVLVDAVQIVGPLGHTLFGFSVHYASGVLAVGAPHEQGGGAVYTYKLDSVLLANDRFAPEEASPRQEFGYSVLVTEDATDVLVGSPGFGEKGAVDRLNR